MIGILVVVFANALQVRAATSKQYVSDHIMQQGLFVTVGEGGKVYPAPSRAVSAIVGVVSSQVQDENGGYATEVVVEGRVSAIVSNANGAIKNGDRLMLSMVDGVAVKAEQESTAIAIAKEDLTPQQGSYGVIAVELVTGSRAAAGQQGGIKGMIRNLTGKSVSDIRIILAFLIFGLVFIVDATLISSSANSSLIAIGRNPLSKISIVNSFSHVLVIAFIAIAVGLAAAAGILLF